MVMNIKSENKFAIMNVISNEVTYAEQQIKKLDAKYKKTQKIDKASKKTTLGLAN